MKKKQTPKPLYTFEIIPADCDPQGNDVTPTQWYWRCRHRNGKIIADGAEGYSSKAKLRRSLERWLKAVRWLANYEIKELK